MAGTLSTFDIDCLTESGLRTGNRYTGRRRTTSSAKMLSVLRKLTALDFVGADVVEVAPAYDHANITAIAGATIAMRIIRRYSWKKRDEPLVRQIDSGSSKTDLNMMRFLNSKAKCMKPKIFIDKACRHHRLADPHPSGRTRRS